MHCLPAFPAGAQDPTPPPLNEKIEPLPDRTPGFDLLHPTMSEEEQGAAPTQGRFRVVHQSGITLEVVVDRTVPAAELLERVIQEMGLPRGDALGRPYPAYLVHEGRTLEGTETLEQVPDDAELEVRLETVVFAGGGVEEPERAARGRTGSPRGAKPPRAAPSAIPAWAKRRADNE